MTTTTVMMLVAVIIMLLRLRIEVISTSNVQLPILKTKN
jgi:hypothetical protein